MATKFKNNLKYTNGFPFAYERDVILELLKELDIVNGNAVADGDTNKCGNYLSDIRRVKVSGKSKNGEDVDLRLIYKAAPTLDKRSQFTSLFFDREILAYDEILPLLQNQQSSVNLGPAKRFLTPKCYKVVKKVGREAIIMEDVSVDGFVMVERKKAQDWTHLSLVVSDFAKLHGLSYVLQERQPKSFEQLANQLKPDVFFSKETSLEKLTVSAKLHEANFKTAQSALTNADHLEILKKLFNNRVEIITTLMSSQYAGSTAVICHGDSWMNNILFQHNKNGEPKKLCFLDWQLMRHASPFVDIMYTIWTCTDEAFRNERYDRVFEHYYKSLSEHLENFEIDAENVYPKKQYLEDKKKYAAYGLFCAILVLPMFLSENINFENWETLEFKDNFRSKNKLYVDRMNGVFKDFFKFGDPSFLL